LIATERSPDSPPSGDNTSGINDHDGITAEDAIRARPRKSAEAFRTISEVADELNVPQHVLRFWETKFPRIKPLKRGGGRRYYRPEDVTLLRRIANLLYTQGYTIKGVQRLLKETGDIPLDDMLGASAGEQAAAEQEDSMPAIMPAGDTPEDLAHEPPRPAPPKAAVQVKENAEAQRLRAVLIELLQALEALRARLR
jgi:DNA-binding transcriptional MerR regulator